MPLRNATAVAAVLLAASVASAREWVSERHRLAITYPDSPEWGRVEAPPDPNCAIMLTYRETEGLLSINVHDMDTRRGITDGGIKSFERGMLKSAPPGVAADILSGRRLVFAGLPAYEAVLRINADVLAVRTTNILVLADGKAYVISMSGADMHLPATHPMRVVASSFRHMSGAETREREDPSSEGERMGRMAVYVLVLVVILIAASRRLRRLGRGRDAPGDGHTDR